MLPFLCITIFLYNVRKCTCITIDIVCGGARMCINSISVSIREEITEGAVIDLKLPMKELIFIVFQPPFLRYLFKGNNIRF